MIPPLRLYVALGSGGMLKLGASRNPEFRKYDLQKTFKEVKEEIVRFTVIDGEIPSYRYELDALKQLHATGTVVKGREWFRDVDFDFAVDVAKKIVDEYQVYASNERAIREAKRTENQKRLAALRMKRGTPARVIDWTISNMFSLWSNI